MLNNNFNIGIGTFIPPSNANHSKTKSVDIVLSRKVLFSMNHLLCIYLEKYTSSFFFFSRWLQAKHDGLLEHIHDTLPCLCWTLAVTPRFWRFSQIFCFRHWDWFLLFLCCKKIAFVYWRLIFYFSDLIFPPFLCLLGSHPWFQPEWMGFLDNGALFPESTFLWHESNQLLSLW